MPTPSPKTPRRSRAQRAIAVRYDELHALLVRSVHPLCFATFALTVLVVLRDLALGSLSTLDTDSLGAIVFFVVIAGILLLGAFLLVLTKQRALAGIACLGGWSAALSVLEPSHGILWTLAVLAAASVVVQLALLVRVVPARWRAGLMHLLVPSTVGTVIGIAPVGLMLLLLRDERWEDATRLMIGATAAGCIVLALLLALHLYAGRGDAAIVTQFANRHSLDRRSSNSSEDGLPLVSELVPKFAGDPLWRAGRIDGRTTTVVSGFTATAQADLPSLHLSVLATKLRRGGTDVWIRRRSWAHDNVLASLGRSEVVGFESTQLSSNYSIHFAEGTSQLDAFVAFGPDVVDLLDRGLGEAQACRIDSTLFLFVVGGVLDADELDQMLETGRALADLFERASTPADPDATPATRR